jgi:hypothetical protein
MLKSSGILFAVLGYLWVAGVGNLDEVRSRKRARRAV